MNWKWITLWAIVVICFAIGFALDWKFDRKKYTYQDDERNEPPRESGPK